MDELHPTARRLQELLDALRLDVRMQVLSDSTGTAADATAALGVEVGQMVKPLVFVRAGEPLICLCAGDRRVDPPKLGAGARPAKADEARSATGFASGVIPPLGHERALPTVVDESRRRFQIVWYVAGTPHAVFGVATELLLGALPEAEVCVVST